MSHFSLIRASKELWVGVVTQEEFWALDEGRFKSINGDDGGTWAPSDPIIIGGAGLEVTGPLTISGATGLSNDVTLTGETDMQGDVTIGVSSADELTVNATATFESPAVFNDSATFGGVLTAWNATIQGDGYGGASIQLGFPGGSDAVDIDANTTITGTLAVDGPLTSNETDLTGPVSITGPVTLGTGATIRKRFLVFVGNHTIACTDYDMLEHSASAVADATITLSATGASNGDMIRIVNRSQTYVVNVTNAGTPIYPTRLAAASTIYGWADYIYDGSGGGWRFVVGYGASS